MNFKTTYLMFAILGIVLGIFAVTQLAGLRSPTESSVYALPSLNDKRNPVRADDIETIEVERSRPQSDKLVFYRTEQGWKLKQPNVRVESYMVDRIFDQVSRAKKEEKANVTRNLSQFGLDAPGITVTLIKKGGDKAWKLNIGNESATGGDFEKVVYITSSDRPEEPLPVRRADLDNLFKNVNDFRAKELLGGSALNTSFVSLQETGKDPVTIEKSDAQWRFQKPAFGEAEYEGEPNTGTGKEQKTLTGVRELIEGIGSLRVADAADFVADDASDADLTKFGLETGKPARLRIEIKRSPSGLLGADEKEKKLPVTEVLLIGNKAEAPPPKKDGKPEPFPALTEEKYYARLENERSVVRIGTKSVEPIVQVATRPDALRNRDLAQFDSFKTDAVDIKNDAGLLKLRRTGAPADWKLYAGSAAVRDADDQTVEDLLKTLTQKRQVKSFPDPSKSDADLGLDKPSAEVAVWVEGIKKDDAADSKKDDGKDAKKDEKKDAKPEEKKDEKKDQSAEPKLKSDKPTVKLVFGKQDGEIVYVRREVGDDKVRLAVPTSVLEKVKPGPLAYLDRALPTFPKDDVTKLVLSRGSEILEIEKEKKDDKAPAVWTFKQPKELAGRLADTKGIEEVLGDLQRLRAETLVAEKAAEGELEKYGLKTPALKAALTLKKDDKSEERIFAFGKETDKDGRYAKLGERDVVFLVRPQTIGSLQAELLDPTIFRLDPAKVTRIKLQGWEKLYKFQLALDLERKSGDAKGWIVKSGPMGFEPDEKKVESFVTDLATLKAERLLKSAPKPEHKLGKTDRSLEIELTVEGEKAPFTLTLGDLEAKDKKAYHAQASSLPGEVFLVPQARFQKLLEEGAKFLSKDAVAAE